MEKGYRSHIHRVGSRKRALNAREQEANRKRATVRARVEHVFAQQPNRQVQTLGKERAAVKIGLMNLVYNMRRWALVDRLITKLYDSYECSNLQAR